MEGYNIRWVTFKVYILVTRLVYGFATLLPDRSDPFRCGIDE
jgi:hypothetical protein